MTVSFKPIVTIEGTLTLSEAELGALDPLAGYDVESFLKVFYEKMGRAYLEPHKAGLRGLFKKVRELTPPALGKVNQMRRDLSDAIRVREDQRREVVA